MSKKVTFVLIGILVTGYLVLFPYLGRGGIILFGVIFGLLVIFLIALLNYQKHN